MLSEYSADAAYKRSLEALDDDDLEREMEKDDKE